MDDHDLAMEALREPNRGKLTAEEIESINTFAALWIANERPADHELAAYAQARAVLGLALSSSITPVWERK